MTEPREREPEPTQGEPVQQQPDATPEPNPEPGSWYPVEARPADAAAAEEENTAQLRTEPAAAEAEPTASVAEEPTAVVADEPAPLDEPGMAPEEPAAAEPAAVVAPAPADPAGDEPTTVQSRPSLPDEPAPGTEPTESIFRAPSPSQSPEPEPTRLEELSGEEQKLAEERAARREARAAALAATAPVPVAEPERVTVYKRTTDKFWGSLGLFLLRLVVAAIVAVRGLNLLTDLPAAQQFFARTIIPEPGLAAMITGVACLLIALSLVLGLLTRVAGLGVALIAGGALAFVYWGNWSPFVPGQPGFLGELELLLAGVGLLFLFVGGGGWGLDRSFRAARQRDKAERSSLGE